MTLEYFLPCGRKAICDEAAAQLVAGIAWHSHRAKQAAERFYVSGRRNGRTVYMHRLIMEAPASLTVDHVNGDGLDNRRINLRVATRGQNNANRTIKNSSGFRGVSITPYGFRAHISAPAGERRKCIHLGYFQSASDAARVYDLAASARWGEFARLNFPPMVPA